MAYTINKKISKYNSSSRNGSSIRYIVIHYVGSVSTAKANATYFAGGNRNASAHFFVDDTSIWQSVETSRASWHCGGGLQSNNGHTFYNKCKNSNSIGIEMCIKKKSGKFYITKGTEKRLTWLVQYLIKKYGINPSNVIRHYDVTGKSCPACYEDDLGHYLLNPNSWKAFHDRICGVGKKKKQTADGKLGENDVKKLQKWLKTTEDGVISGQNSSNKKLHSGITSIKYGNTGSQVVRALQKKLGVKVTGHLNKSTIKAWQTFLNKKGANLVVDGSWGAKTSKETEKWLNKEV